MVEGYLEDNDPNRNHHSKRSKMVIGIGDGEVAKLERRYDEEDLSLLPIAGSFFLSNQRLLNGKVYTIQKKNLPFAAVHGNAEVHDGGTTRFGPTAEVVPALERGELSTVPDFLTSSG